jgi:hypothetical protein
MRLIGSAPARFEMDMPVAIGPHQHRKHMASSAWLVDLASASSLFILQCEISILGMHVGDIYSVSYTGSQVAASKRPIRATKNVSGYSTIEAGAALNTSASERRRSRRHCLIFSLLIGCTKVFCVPLCPVWLHRSCAVLRCASSDWLNRRRRLVRGLE